jgi:hypothetical protein
MALTFTRLASKTGEENRRLSLTGSSLLNNENQLKMSPSSLPLPFLRTNFRNAQDNMAIVFAIFSQSSGI